MSLSLGRLAKRSGRLKRPAFLGLVFVLALVIRLALVWALLRSVPARIVDYNNFGWESWEMGWTARSIFLGHGFSSPFLPRTGPTALVPPLYPYLLAGMFHLFGFDTVRVGLAVLGLNGLFSALTCIPLYVLARSSLSERTSRLVALSWALYPFSLYFATHRVWDYALTALLFSCSLVVAQRLPRLSAAGWLGFGALYGLTVLSNPSVATLLPIFLLIACYRRRRNHLPWLRRGLLAALAFCAVCAPWQLRNHRAMRADFFIRDGFWLEFYAGNNGDTFVSNSGFVHPATNPAEMRQYERLGEIRYMAEKRDLAVRFVRQHPGSFAVATLRRAVRFWTGYWSFAPPTSGMSPWTFPMCPSACSCLHTPCVGCGGGGGRTGSRLYPICSPCSCFPSPTTSRMRPWTIVSPWSPCFSSSW